MAQTNNDRVKIAGYARRIFFNDNIEYRNFSPDLVGFQLTSEGGTTLFTNGNFSIDVNLDPKPNVIFKQGTKSKFYTLNDIISDSTELTIQKNITAGLNLDLTNPLSYVWYGSASELIRSSLENIEERWPAAIYVDNKVGSISGNNITNYTYDIINDESTFTVNSRFFVNPYNIQYTRDAAFTGTTLSPIESRRIETLRNFTIHYKSYVIEHNGIIKNIKDITPTTQVTNDNLEIIVDGNPFPELTGIFIPQMTFLLPEASGSIPFFIKPNEIKRENFFTSLNNIQKNLLNRESYPPYLSIIISPKITDSGVIVTTKDILKFPLLEDGYNLDFFTSFYISYLDKINEVGENYDLTSTDIIIRKYTAEVINSFDTIPRGDGDDLILNGEKATKLLRIYGVAFDDVKKYINGIKFAHVVTYDKKNNIPDSLVKDLAHMLGFQTGNFVTDVILGKTILPSLGGGQFSGTSTELSTQQIDIELYRRLILNISWLWKSKGSRKAVEFLFRFIGAPESLVRFNEYIVIVDKPLDMDKIKELLYLYTGQDPPNIDHIPYDENGFPLPPINGELVITDFISGADQQTGVTSNQLNIVENEYTQMYFQKSGGWYRETFGDNAAVTILEGNNPHVGPYDGGNEYLHYFSRCYIPNFTGNTSITINEKSFSENSFLNYNYGIFNSIDTDTVVYTSEVTFNLIEDNYQLIGECLEVSYDIIESPLQDDGQTVSQTAYDVAVDAYNEYIEKIKVYPYLVFSPQWQTIKYNYEIATQNYSNELVTEECVTTGASINQSLEICLTPHVIDENVDDISICDQYEVVIDDESGGIYFADPISHIMVVFSEFAECCEALNVGGLTPKYVSYHTPNDFTFIEYCTFKTPCEGIPLDVDEDDGIVIWELINNTMPSNVYMIEDECYQFQEDMADWCANHQMIGYDADSGTYSTFGDPEFNEWVYNNPAIVQNSSPCFIMVPCDTTTKYSSLDCCAYHGYESQMEWLDLDGDGDPELYVFCIDLDFIAGEGSLNRLASPGREVGEAINVTMLSIAKLEEKLETNIPPKQKKQIKVEISQKNRQLNELGKTKINYDNINLRGITPEMVIGYSKYKKRSNRNAPRNPIPQLTKTTKLPKIVRSGLGPINVVSTDLYSLGIPPELKSHTLWETHVDDWGRATFFAEYKNVPYVLDWNTPVGAGSVAYQRIAEAKKLRFGPVKFNFNNRTLVPIRDTKKNPWENSVTQAIYTAAILPTMVSCEDIDNVSIVLGSNGGNGFKLPADPECNCSIDISFDYMLKYNAGNLIACVGECGACMCNLLDDNGDTISSIQCLPAIFCKVSLDNMYCLDFITFVGTEDEQNLLLQNFQNPQSDSEYTIWQSEVTQLEPSIECCEALGGTVVPWVVGGGWYALQAAYYQSIHPQPAGFNEHLLLTYDYSISTNTEYLGLTTDQTILESLMMDIRESGCMIFPPWDLPEYCDVKYPNYFTTENTCAIFPPADCGRWMFTITKLKADYSTALTMQALLEACVEEYNNIIDLIEEAEQMILDIQTQIDELEEEADEADLGGLGDEDDDDTTPVPDPDPDPDTDEELNGLITDNATITTGLGAGDNDILIIDFTIYDPVVDKILLDLKPNKLRENCNAQFRLSNGFRGAIDQKQLKSCIASRKKKLEENLYNFSEISKKNKSLENFYIQLSEAKKKNKTDLITTLTKKINDTQSNIDSITQTCGSFLDDNPKLELSSFQKIGKKQTIDNIADMLGVEASTITADSGNISLTGKQKIFLNEKKVQNDARITKLTKQSNQLKGKRKENENAQLRVGGDAADQLLDLEDDLAYWEAILEGLLAQLTEKECCEMLLLQIQNVIVELENMISFAEERAEACYTEWCNQIQENYNNMEVSNCTNYIDYIDDLKLNFKLFVDNSNDSVSQTQTNIESALISLPYTQDANPIWEWDPYAVCKGIILDGSEEDIAEVTTVIVETLTDAGVFVGYVDPTPMTFTIGMNTIVWPGPSSLTDFSLLPTELSKIIENSTGDFIKNKGQLGWVGDLTELVDGNTYTFFSLYDFTWIPVVSMTSPSAGQLAENLFKPCWRTVNISLPDCVCEHLTNLYPGKQFYIGIEIENYECAVCVLVDNIKVNITDCEIQKLISTTNCYVPQLSCVIDNKKSWVYTDKGINVETIYPNGPCNTGNTENYSITKLINPVNRLWQELEYRYTEYDVYHSDLIINTKSATFAIDPANAIECDVYNFWKQINCDECPTSCVSGNTVFFSGKVQYTGDSLSSYSLPLSGTTPGGLTFSCDTYTNILSQQIIELKNDYYSLTADYNQSLNATYEDLLEKDGSLSLFTIEENNCGSDNIIIGNNEELDNLFGIIVESEDGTISFWETFIFSGTTPHAGGTEIEVFSGVTAQTFNQTTTFDEECCESINLLLTSNGINGLGIDKKYIWNNTLNACTWMEINDCEGDCEYSGVENVNSISGVSTGKTCEVIQVPVCVNPLDYLDVAPSTINVKQVFDDVVLSNLIDVKNRQTISGYPMLQLFYQLYLNASNCGEEFSGKLTYNNLFQFMDKIGDYWLDLLEQVVPATTIWEGCNNSGKVYRNTIFDQNKYVYRKYSLNYMEQTPTCPLSAFTSHSIGSASVDIRVNEQFFYPTNLEIEAVKSKIFQIKKDIRILKEKLKDVNNEICAAHNADLGGFPTFFFAAVGIKKSFILFGLSIKTSLLSIELIELKTLQEALNSQQGNFQQVYAQCSGIATQLNNARNNLENNFIPGTTAYARQSHFIAGLRDEYNKCVRRANTQISDYNTVFITHINASNEYEGSVMVTGDPEWAGSYMLGNDLIPAGPFYNTELLHDCD